MKIAAIDIGSNAIRLQITNVLEYEGKVDFKKIEYIRFPLRLGHDVFNEGKISEKSFRKFKKLMHTFKLLLELYEVDDYMACATSAMRESSNGQQIVDEVENDLGLRIEIIDGNDEASIINKAIFRYLDTHSFLHIDVGGGSTELTFWKNSEKSGAKSFKIGSVRKLEHLDSPEIWESMKHWVEQQKVNHPGITAVGTGGNINKLYELAGLAQPEKLSLENARTVREMLLQHKEDYRINVLRLNPDRADVIIPASEIYIEVMEWAGAQEIIVPDVGLKDGILQSLYYKLKSQQELF